VGRLRELICDRGQDYDYARPIPPPDLAGLLAAGIAPARASDLQAG
jgi:hypothetical protein